ncbi:MAG: hypothetical protein ACFFAY_05920 [Promethearchaeota archaeon]
MESPVVRIEYPAPIPTGLVGLEAFATTTTHMMNPKTAIPIGIKENGKCIIGYERPTMLSAIQIKATKKHTAMHFEAPVF